MSFGEAANDRIKLGWSWRLFALRASVFSGLFFVIFIFFLFFTLFSFGFFSVFPQPKLEV